MLNYVYEKEYESKLQSPIVKGALEGSDKTTFHEDFQKVPLGGPTHDNSSMNYNNPIDMMERRKKALLMEKISNMHRNQQQFQQQQQFQLPKFPHHEISGRNDEYSFNEEDDYYNIKDSTNMY
jgi:hypothetical protein